MASRYVRPIRLAHAHRKCINKYNVLDVINQVGQSECEMPM